MLAFALGVITRLIRSEFQLPKDLYASLSIYLLFALGRADVLPAADLALLIAYQRIKGTKTRPDPKRMAQLAEAWRPWRGAVAHLLWHVYKQPL